MKAFNLSKIVATVCLLSTSAFAAVGNDSGNGGGGIVCLQPNGTKTVTLLDLTEASSNPQLTLKRSNTPWEQQLENALQKYAAVHSDYVELMRNELSYIENNTIKVKGAQRLPPPADTQISNLDQPRNCFLEGVANYDDVKGKLYIDEELEQLLPETDKAALRFHEAWYKVQRSKMSATGNSKGAREATGYVFAQQPLDSIPANLGVENAISQCVSEDSRYQFFVIPQSQGYELLFARISGIVMGERTSMIVPSNENVAGRLAVEGDVQGALAEGFSMIKRSITKAEKASGSSGTSVLSQKHIFGVVKSKYGPSLKILVTSSDWASNEGDTKVSEISANGFSGSGYETSWNFKKASTYENLSNYISVQTAGTNIFQSKHYSNGVNSRFNCAPVR
jgi:hypothetical protein